METYDNRNPWNKGYAHAHVFNLDGQVTVVAHLYPDDAEGVQD